MPYINKFTDLNEDIVIEKDDYNIVIKVMEFDCGHQAGVAAYIEDKDGNLITRRNALKLKPIED